MRIIPKRRRLENRTNYTKRKRLLEHSSARIVVRKSNRYITAQYIETREARDYVKVSVVSNMLVDYGWPESKEGSMKNLGAAYLTGLLLGTKLKALKISKVILDSGLIRSTKGSRVYATVKGIIDAGINLPCDKEVFPEEKRIMSEEIKSFFDKVKAEIIKGGKK
jgi:large subunit ribosomal protein L18